MPAHCVFLSFSLHLYNYMKQLTYLVFVLAIVFMTSAQTKAQTQQRLMGARRLVLDNNDLITANNVYLVDNFGSLGIDNAGNIVGGFPNLCALVDMRSTTKGVLFPR